jgi:mono/diheme cytochrome c family protein
LRRLWIASLVFPLFLVAMVSGQKLEHTRSSALVARGKYLVDDVATCGDCHTPRNDKGEPMKDRYLRGAAIDFKPTVPVPVWADKAPDIAGLPGWQKDAAIRFFMTGIGYNGLPRRPPMPQFRFNVQDAEAVVAYLKSIEPK